MKVYGMLADFMPEVMFSLQGHLEAKYLGSTPQKATVLFS